MQPVPLRIATPLEQLGAASFACRALRNCIPARYSLLLAVRWYSSGTIAIRISYEALKFKLIANPA